jgi:hypothetical protein
MSWAINVENIFHVHNYPEEKIMAMASIQI